MPLKKHKKELTVSQKMKKDFRKEIQEAVKQKLSEINHYVAGCDSPFGYLTVREVQEKMCEIAEILGIEYKDGE